MNIRDSSQPPLNKVDNPLTLNSIPSHILENQVNQSHNEKDSINKNSNDSCLHEVIIHGICVDCCQVVPESSRNDFVLPGFISNERNFALSKEKAAQMESEWINDLLRKKKLCLILDLDNTLIHASYSKLPDDLQVPLLDLLSPHSTESNWMHGFDLSLGYPHYYNFDNSNAWNHISKIEKSVLVGKLNPGLNDATQLYIKLRPNVIKFLSKMSNIFQLYLFTMGTEEHAIASLRILDPSRHFFGQRIFSRDDGYQGLKSLKRIVPFNEDMVIIIDDTEAIWGRVKSCIKVHAYFFFPMIKSLEELENCFLSKILAMLQAYAHHHSPSTLKEIQQKIPASQHYILFSDLSESSDFSVKEKSQNLLHKKHSNLDTKDQDTPEISKYALENNSTLFDPLKNNPPPDISLSVDSLDRELQESSLSSTSSSKGCLKSQSSIPESCHTFCSTSNIIEYDRQLLYLETLLCSIHQSFFFFHQDPTLSHSSDGLHPNVSEIIEFFTNDILKGIKFRCRSPKFTHFSDLGYKSREFGATFSKNHYAHILDLPINSEDSDYTHILEFPINLKDQKSSLDSTPNELPEQNIRRVLLMWLEYAIYTFRKPESNLTTLDLGNYQYSSFWEAIKDLPIGDHSDTVQNFCCTYKPPKASRQKLFANFTSPCKRFRLKTTEDNSTETKSDLKHQEICGLSPDWDNFWDTLIDDSET